MSSHTDNYVRCLPASYPEEIEVDINELDIDDRLSVADISLPEEIEILDDLNTRIVAVVPPRIEEEPEAEVEEGMEVEVEADEDAEPEVISRRSADEEDENKYVESGV